VTKTNIDLVIRTLLKTQHFELTRQKLLQKLYDQSGGSFLSFELNPILQFLVDERVIVRETIGCSETYRLSHNYLVRVREHVKN
jgi:hypothetical protein